MKGEGEEGKSERVHSQSIGFIARASALFIAAAFLAITDPHTFARWTIVAVSVSVAVSVAVSVSVSLF